MTRVEVQFSQSNPAIRQSNYPITRLSNYPILLLVHLHRIDDADDGRIDRTIFHPRGHACGAAADNEYGLADAGIDRIDRHARSAVGPSARTDGPCDQKLVAH